MLKYRSRKLIRVGVLGIVLAMLLVAVGLQPERLIAWATSVRYTAEFGDAGGLEPGCDVMVSGTKVGTVSTVELRDGKAVAEFTVKSTVRLKSQTTAHIKTGTLLGKRILVLKAAGDGRLRAMSTIPLSRTSSPYSLTDAVSELTTNIEGTDTGQLNQSLDTLSATLDRIAPQLGPTFDGLTRLSKTLNERDDSLRQLLSYTGDVTKVLAERSDQVNTLILNANSLLGVLVERRQAIVELLANTNVVATQLSGLVADNEHELAPALDRLNSVSAMLEKNRDNIGKAIPGLAKQAQTTGESVSSGPFYNAFISNLPQGQFLKPLIDAAFNIQPRGTFPFPTCGDDGDCYNREETPPVNLPAAPR
ncbi:MCE family protein [Mycobacterium sp. NPDC050441]|uniref:MCE family protein n=1 Tax=Mycobacterium sp. NPDC050441 TaxID=3155403 RepID=UPI0033E74EF1